jgi:uncharacterized protein involved in exopolysaccharide biosynthesis
MNNVTYVKNGEQRDFSFLNSVLRRIRANRKFTYIAVIISFVAACPLMMLVPNTYTASAKVAPTLSSSGGEMSPFLSSVIQEAGAMSSLLPKLSKEGLMYIVLLKSPRVVNSVLNREYVDSKGTPKGNLFDLFHQKNPEKARQKLLSLASFECDIKTGVVTISATTNDPAISAQIANTFVGQLDSFKQELDRTMAGKVGSYLQERLDEEQNTLQQAEEKLTAFLASNRNYGNGDDPQMKMDIDRIERDVILHRQVFTNLMQLKSSTDMETQKTTPRLIVIEQADPPTLKSGPHRVNAVLLIMFATIFFTIGISIFKESYSRYFPVETKEEMASSYVLIRKDVSSALHSIRRPFRIPKQPVE